MTTVSTRFPLRRLRLRPGEELSEQVVVALEPFALGGLPYVPAPALVDAALTISRATGGDVFRLRFETSLHGPCVRCLEAAELAVAADGTEYHDADTAADPDLRSDYVVEDQLELSSWARDLVALELPDQILCRADCAGLCPVCGRDLNVEPHAHDEQRSDPRWAALEALRDDL